jgi:hypothetical protein
MGKADLMAAAAIAAGFTACRKERASRHGLPPKPGIANFAVLAAIKIIIGNGRESQYFRRSPPAFKKQGFPVSGQRKTPSRANRKPR